jgi:hypothetical protein
MSQNLDIYTLKPIRTKSEEHIIQAALGGRLTSGNILDGSTNSTFGHTIDADLEKSLRDFRLIMGVTSDQGRPPKDSVVRGEDGRTYRIYPGGKLEVVPSGKIEKVDERTYRLEAQVGSESDLRQMLRKKAKESGHDLNELVKKAMALGGSRREPSPTLTFEMKGWGGNHFRAIAKCVCNLLAHNERELFLTRDFDPIRTFILEEAGQDNWEHFIYPISFNLPDSLGEVDHFVRVERLSSGEVLGVVVYFGVLAFLVRLGTTPLTFASHSYRIDPLGKVQRTDEACDLSWPLPAWACDRTMQDHLDSVEEQLGKLIPTAMRVQRRLWLGSIMEPFLHKWAEAEEANGGLLDEAKRNEFIGPMISALIRELAPAIAADSARRREARESERQRLALSPEK